MMERILVAIRGGEEQRKRADVESAVTSCVISHISSHSSVASHISAMPGVVIASKSKQLLEATKCKRITTHETLYRNGKNSYVTKRKTFVLDTLQANSPRQLK
jgi:hypothetical protein